MTDRVTPQFSIDDLYISPFTKCRAYDPDTGKPYYKPMERNLKPTGVQVLDDMLLKISNGNFVSRKDFAAKYSVTEDDLNGFCKMLTGMGTGDLYCELRKRLIDDLLRYTQLPMSTLAKRSGFNSNAALTTFVHTHHRCSPSSRRTQLRQRHDAGRYGI